MTATDQGDVPRRERRQRDWAEAFASAAPERQWAAACSVARCITGGDAWADSTAVHEAACGAWDAVTGRSGLTDPVPAAVLGARRALHWERQARTWLMPAADLGVHRWRAMTDADPSELVPLADAEGTEIATAGRRAESDGSTVARWLGPALDAAGWAWPLPAGEAVGAAIDAVLSAGRDHASALLGSLYPRLPVPVAAAMVTLVAGSRTRDHRCWPGVIWLQAHHGSDAAGRDPGTLAAIAAAVAGRQARPGRVIGAAIRPTGRGPYPDRRSRCRSVVA